MAAGADEKGRNVNEETVYATNQYLPWLPNLDMSYLAPPDWGELEPGGYPVPLDSFPAVGSNHHHHKINGDARANVIIGGRGNDDIDGKGGDDEMWGDNKSDKAFGPDGQDRILGGAGDDRIYGGGETDTLSGGDGNDSIWGGTGADRMLGDAGDDEMHGGAGSDMLNGGDGDDEIRGDAGSDTLEGSSGDDYIYGGKGDDLLLGGQGDDYLYGGKGDDMLLGAEGKDRFLFEAGGKQTDTVLGFSALDDMLIFDRSMKGDISASYDDGEDATVLRIRLDDGPRSDADEYREVVINGFQFQNVDWNEDSEFHKFANVIA